VVALTLETCDLLGLLDRKSLSSLVQLSLSLQSHDSASPLAHQFSVLVKLLQSQVLEDLELGGIFLVHSCERNNSSSLLVDESSKARLILHNHEGNLHLAAESREPKDELNRVNITRDENKGSFLLLNQGCDMLETKLKLMGHVGGLALSFRGIRGSSSLTLFLRSCGLGTVVVKKFEHTRGLVLANGFGELVNGRGNLKTLVEDGALTLDTHVFGPSDESTKVAACGADGSTDVEGTGAGGEKRIGLGRGGLDGGLTLGLRGFLGCHGDGCRVFK